MSYEGSNEQKSANITAAMDAYATLRGHIVVHTSTLPILFLILFVATGYQGLSAFGGDLWRLEHHYDFFSSDLHHFAVNASVVLNVEHPFHDYLKDHPEVHPDHPHHHSNLEKIVASHVQMDFLYVVFHGYFLLLISAALRGFFFLKRQSYLTTLIIMYVILVSAIIQGIALVINILILFTAPSIWIWVKIFATFLSLLIEISTFLDIHEIRKYVMYFSQIFHEYKYQKMLNNPESVSPEESQKTKEMITQPFLLFDAIQNSIANLDELSLNQRKRKKID